MSLQLNIFEPDKTRRPPVFKVFEPSPHECFLNLDLTDSDCRVYLAISKWIFEHGERDPDMSAIAASIGKTRGAMYLSIERLEAAGQIGVERGHRNRILWIWTTLRINRAYQDRAQDEVSKAPQKRPRGAHTGARQEAEGAHTGARRAHSHARLDESGAHTGARQEAEGAHLYARPSISTDNSDRQENVTSRVLAHQDEDEERTPEPPEPGAVVTPEPQSAAAAGMTCQAPVVPSVAPASPPRAEALPSAPAPSPTGLLSPEVLAEYEAQAAGGNPVLARLARVAIRDHEAALEAATRPPVPGPAPAPSPPVPTATRIQASTPLPTAPISDPRLTPTMHRWPDGLKPASEIEVTTEVLLRRVVNPTFDAEPAIQAAVDRLADVLEDWGSKGQLRRMVEQMRARSEAGDRRALSKVVAALKCAMTADRKGARFTAALASAGFQVRANPPRASPQSAP